MEQFFEYGSIKLLEIFSDKPYDWSSGMATHLKVTLPSDNANIKYMLKNNFYYADRTLEVSIIPAGTKLDYGKMPRLRPEITNEHKEELFDIAVKSFHYDRRFHIEPEYNQMIAATILEYWINDLSSSVVFVAKIKSEVAGFLALNKINEDVASIHLAATLEKFRLSGVALSLYAYAVSYANEQGFKVITGCISTLNTPVLNLYSYLGATFSNPKDIFLKII